MCAYYFEAFGRGALDDDASSLLRADDRRGGWFAGRAVRACRQCARAERRGARPFSAWTPEAWLSCRLVSRASSSRELASRRVSAALHNTNRSCQCWMLETTPREILRVKNETQIDGGLSRGVGSRRASRRASSTSVIDDFSKLTRRKQVRIRTLSIDRETKLNILLDTRDREKRCGTWSK